MDIRGAPMSKMTVTILEFLATQIEVTVAKKIVNNNIKILASGCADYAGYIGGEFLEPNDLRVALAKAVAEVKTKYPKGLDRIFVSVPAEFCSYALRNLKADYQNKLTIRQRHIDDLFATLNDDIDGSSTIISKNPIYYVLDDGVQTYSPLYAYSKSLAVKASCMLVKNDFINQLSTILDELGIREYIFLPTVLAEDNYLVAEAARQQGAIVVDFDYVSTTVSSIVGEGVVDLKTFAMGEGHILADLSEVLKIKYASANFLKSQLILTLQPNPMDVYEVASGTGVDKINANVANEVVIARLEVMAELINKILVSFQFKPDPNQPIYITGKGCVDIKGFGVVMSKLLNRRVEIVVPDQLVYSKPQFSSKLSLINFVYYIA